MSRCHLDNALIKEGRFSMSTFATCVSCGGGGSMGVLGIKRKIMGMLDRVFGRKNEPNLKKVEKIGRGNMGGQEAEESKQRDRLVKSYGFKQGDFDLIVELQDPEKGNLRFSKDPETGSDVISCRYLGHEWESRTDEKRYPFLLMDGARQDEESPGVRDFRRKLEVYSNFLKKQEKIPENAMAELNSAGNLKWLQNAENRNIALRAINNFLGRSS